MSECDFPHVTDIIGAVFPIGGDPAMLEFAGERGTAIHHACALLAGGGDGSGLAMETLNPTHVPYVEAYRRYLADTGLIVCRTEVHVISERYHFQGTLDVLSNVPMRAIADLKSGQPRAITALQLAAYEAAWREQSGERTMRKRFAVHLQPTGRYTVQQYADSRDFTRFLACLELFNWLRKKR